MQSSIEWLSFLCTYLGLKLEAHTITLSHYFIPNVVSCHQPINYLCVKLHSVCGVGLKKWRVYLNFLKRHREFFPSAEVGTVSALSTQMCFSPDMLSKSQEWGGKKNILWFSPEAFPPPRNHVTDFVVYISVRVLL